MLRLIYGPDTFTAHAKLRETLAAHASGDSEGDSVQFIDGRNATPGAVIEACTQVSMFAVRRVVVVEGLIARFSGAGSRRKSGKTRKQAAKQDDLGEWKGFSDRVRSLGADSILILIDAEVKEPNALLDELAEVTDDVTRCPPLRRQELIAWIQVAVAARGGRIDGAAAPRLADIVGPDLWLMNSEVEKLVLYADGQPITVNLVDDMAASAPTPTIFMLVDAVVERNVRQARRHLDDLYTRGLPPGYVFTMVNRQLRLIAQLHEVKGRSGTQALSGELASLPPFALQQATRQARRLSEPETRCALEQVVAADRSIKTGLFTDRMALDMLITEIVGSGER